MKKKLTYILIFLWSIIGLNFYAQTTLNCPGDSVYLELPIYSGSIQWQESSDSITWTNISGANYQPYGFVFSATKLYRAMVTATGCSPIYSPIKKIQQDANCPVYAPGSIFCSGAVTRVSNVTSPTGKIWMDRNLGASSTDALAYGDLYQWGRASDGHQCRNSTTTSTLSSTGQPANAYFILAPNAPNDWITPQDTNLWQGVNGINNPCPSGYRIPTETELNNERLSWVQAPISSTNTSAGAFASPLKLPLSGRLGITGTLSNVGTGGYYWSSMVSSTSSRYLYFSSSFASMDNLARANGYTVRCIKD